MTNKLDASPATVSLDAGASEPEMPDPSQREEIVWGQTPTGEGKMPIHITFPKKIFDCPLFLALISISRPHNK